MSAVGHDVDDEPAAKRPRCEGAPSGGSASTSQFQYTYEAPTAAATAGKKRSDLGNKMIRFEGASDRTERKALAAACESHGAIAFIDFRYGETSGYVRFKTADGAQAAHRALGSAPPEISGATPRWRMLSEEEAEATAAR